MLYRCVKSNTSEVVIAIGRDENQSGVDYHSIGTWETFTFDTIPTISAEIQTWVDTNNYEGSLLKVVAGAVVLRTIAELDAEIA